MENQSADPSGSSLLRLLRWPVLLVLVIILVSIGDGPLRLNVAQRAATPYLYDLFGWETANFMSKWLNRVSAAVPFAGAGVPPKDDELFAYFDLNDDINRLRADLNQAAARSGTEARTQSSILQQDLNELQGKKLKMRGTAEEAIESAVSKVVVEESLSTLGEFIFPPVDVRLTDPPKLLITSPRDRIERTHDVLLRSSVRVSDREAIENELLENEGLSAIVLDIGGIATYPASIPSNQPLRWTLQAATHEWLHHYFFFRPLGQNMFNNGDMVSLNETIANITGKEIGDRVYIELGGEIPQEPPAPRESDNESEGTTAQEMAQRLDEDRFDFNREMRVTRLKVDELLAEGNVDEAEAYMEERRAVFVANGYFIRKLNQAYFAFHGTYADTAASVSPIGDQVSELRGFYPDIGSFVRAASQISSYEQFVDQLEKLKANAAAQ